VTALVWPILAASLLGSPHCAGMCGAFAYLAAPGPHPPRAAAALYHGARLAGYAVLGALAGALGASLDRLGTFAGVGRAGAIVAGTVMVLWGLTTVLRALGVRVPPIPRLTVARPTPAKVPCGWLWVFVAAAAATGSPLTGAAQMSVFWLGTLPAFAALGLLAQGAAGALRRYLPVVTGTVLIIFGAFTLLKRGSGSHAMHMRGPAPTAPAAHGGHHSP
jgi:sulfite exporter TauE/SafE